MVLGVAKLVENARHGVLIKKKLFLVIGHARYDRGGRLKRKRCQFVAVRVGSALRRVAQQERYFMCIRYTLYVLVDNNQCEDWTRDDCGPSLR